MRNDFITRAHFLDHLKPGDALVMRAAPGSGKSTLVEAVKAKAKTMRIPSNGQEHVPWVGIASADQFRMIDGQYVFKSEENGLIHGKCVREFIRICGSYVPQYDIIVCDNTNIRSWEAAPYVAIAAAYGYNPCIVNIECDPKIAADRNLHGVPAGNVNRMAEQARREHLPSQWDQVTIIEEK